MLFGNCLLIGTFRRNCSRLFWKRKSGKIPFPIRINGFQTARLAFLLSGWYLQPISVEVITISHKQAFVCKREAVAAIEDLSPCPHFPNFSLSLSLFQTIITNLTSWSIICLRFSFSSNKNKLGTTMPYLPLGTRTYIRKSKEAYGYVHPIHINKEFWDRQTDIEMRERESEWKLIITHVLTYASVGQFRMRVKVPTTIPQKKQKPEWIIHYSSSFWHLTMLMMRKYERERHFV